MMKFSEEERKNIEKEFFNRMKTKKPLIFKKNMMEENEEWKMQKKNLKKL